MHDLRWPEGRLLEDDLGHWKIAYVKPRNEKALARDCEQREIGFYLPLYVKRTRRRDNNKPRKSVAPLFPGYFPFVAKDDNQRKLLETNRIVNLIPVLDQQQFVDDMNRIRTALSSNVKILGVQPLEPGQTVRIKDGPLMGMTAVVKKMKSESCVMLTVDALQMAMCVQIDPDLVAPI